jgi:hypothetical protein
MANSPILSYYEALRLSRRDETRERIAQGNYKYGFIEAQPLILAAIGPDAIGTGTLLSIIHRDQGVQK